MLSWHDCLGLSELSPEEIAAIARELRVPDIVAAEIGACLVCLCQTPEGRELLQRMSGGSLRGT
jgi:hypothetical protein